MCAYPSDLFVLDQSFRIQIDNINSSRISSIHFFSFRSSLFSPVKGLLSFLDEKTLHLIAKSNFKFFARITAKRHGRVNKIKVKLFLGRLETRRSLELGVKVNTKKKRS